MQDGRSECTHRHQQVDQTCNYLGFLGRYGIVDDRAPITEFELVILYSKCSYPLECCKEIVIALVHHKRYSLEALNKSLFDALSLPAHDDMSKIDHDASCVSQYDPSHPLQWESTFRTIITGPPCVRYIRNNDCLVLSCLSNRFPVTITAHTRRHVNNTS